MIIEEKQNDIILPMLKKSAMFKYISENEQIHFINSCDFISYDDGEAIITEGELSTYFFVILKGVVNISVSRNGEEVYITTLGDCDVIGESAIFLNFKRTANVIAAMECKVLRINRELFMKYIKENPQAGIKILMFIVYHLLTKLKTTDDELAYERTCHVSQDDVDGLIDDFMKQMN